MTVVQLLITMLFRQSLSHEFEKKAEDLRRYVAAHESGVGHYLVKLRYLEGLNAAELRAVFSNGVVDGAVPSGELERGSFSFPFAERWDNHEQARRWASHVLDHRSTFAADGSQIYTGKETLLPIAAVQIGWFENPHTSDSAYEKNATFQILAPDELLAEWQEPMNPDIRVEAFRYLGEVDRICDFLRRKAGWRERGERMPVAFFDNPLLVPFSQKGLQRKFLDATVDLVQLSRDTEVPVIGYVDRSFSRDIITMLETVGEGDSGAVHGVFDASILCLRDGNGSRVLDNWGDRTCFCYSNRRGLESFLDTESGRSSVGFVYLQTTAESTPARLDVPAWVYQSGHLDELVDVVRAECIVGLGYPYALETADQTAVISARDREVFFRALQDFMTRGKLDFSVSRKDTSKKRRR